MNTILKHIVARTYKPWLEKYLSQTRVYRYGNIRLTIPPEVFHPGFFFSTRLLLRHIRTLPLKGKKLLELGAGSGLIAIDAARKGAIVTATDINPVAIRYLRMNSEKNEVKSNIILSDLFRHIPPQQFDIIAINPPYYKKIPAAWIDHAWFCGEQGEYFTGLFSQLADFVHAGTSTIMILCDGCDIRMIETTAAQYGFRMCCVQTCPTLLERNFIFKIEQLL